MQKKLWSLIAATVFAVTVFAACSDDAVENAINSISSVSSVSGGSLSSATSGSAVSSSAEGCFTGDYAPANWTVQSGVAMTVNDITVAVYGGGGGGTATITVPADGTIGFSWKFDLFTPGQYGDWLKYKVNSTETILATDDGSGSVSDIVVHAGDTFGFISWGTTQSSSYLSIISNFSFKGSKKIDTAAIAGVAAPVTGETPVTSITETSQYTGTVSWSPTNATFSADTAYTATVTLTPKSGYTLKGVTANYFTITGASSVTHAADSGVITAVFPKTAYDGALGFTGDFAPAKWTPDASLVMTANDFNVTIYGGGGGAYEITVPAAGTISFGWKFDLYAYGQYGDWFRYKVNTTETTLATDDGAGSIANVVVNAGDTFSFIAWGSSQSSSYVAMASNFVYTKTH